MVRPLRHKVCRPMRRFNGCLQFYFIDSCLPCAVGFLLMYRQYRHIEFVFTTLLASIITGFIKRPPLYSRETSLYFRLVEKASFSRRVFSNVRTGMKLYRTSLGEYPAFDGNNLWVRRILMFTSWYNSSSETSKMLQMIWWAAFSAYSFVFSIRVRFVYYPARTRL